MNDRKPSRENPLYTEKELRDLKLMQRLEDNKKERSTILHHLNAMYVGIGKKMEKIRLDLINIEASKENLYSVDENTKSLKERLANG